ncbi:hypothetical protein CBR_g88569 [Chara braunii]|uniref:Uncharacterized protein n=1 Tax=Chara braunii TaxID=69332 RepID=A0A388KB52_CHABU|nr:hypothetical protein CBR_g88569 [Chara braunii]|eukprot:GBG67280.1 hypothetical protein CBR_g88569 [Chara braunii]
MYTRIGPERSVRGMKTFLRSAFVSGWCVCAMWRNTCTCAGLSNSFRLSVEGWMGERWWSQIRMGAAMAGVCIRDPDDVVSAEA